MEVILLERVEKLGAIGDVVTVKDGFARNFLLPNKKALRSNAANKKVFEANRERIVTENASRRADAEKESKSLDGVSVTLIRQASNTGQLYGSVAVRDIAEAVTAAGYTVDRSQIVLDRPIKTIGMHRVRVMLHPEVGVTVTANVAQSEEGARMQAAGIDPAQQIEQEEQAARAEAQAAWAAAQDQGEQPV
jgi:large subunit ribosomal protein L9